MPKSFKLLQISKHFDPDRGGIETVTGALGEALRAEGITADVLCMGLKGHVYPPVARRHKVVRCAPDLQLGNKTLSLGYMREVARLQPEYDAALLHLPNPVGMLAALTFWRKPLFLLWHADIPQPRVRMLLAPMDRLAIKRSARVIVPTPIHASGSTFAVEMAGKTAVAPYPFDRSRLSVAALDSSDRCRLDGFIGKRRLVLAVGRLVAYKGFNNLVAAAAALPADMVVVIVGTGGLHDALAAQVEALGLNDRILLAGQCGDSELSALFARAEVFCLPSITNAEMYGIVQVEALAAGVPIVSTSIPHSGVIWVNRNEVSGLVVPPGDSDALARAINRIAGDPALHARLAAGAHRLFDEEHDLARAGARYASIIRSALGDRSQPETGCRADTALSQ